MKALFQRKRSLLSLLLVTLLLAQAGCVAVKKEPLQVSIVQLLAHPKEYHGKEVVTEGFYHDEFESSAVYLSRDDAKRLINRNGFWLRFSPALDAEVGRLNDDFVRIRGRFNWTPEGGGHFWLWAGEITNVVSMTRLPEREIGSPRSDANNRKD